MAELNLYRFLNDSMKESFNTFKENIWGNRIFIINDSQLLINISMFIRFLELYYIGHAFDSLKRTSLFESFIRSELHVSDSQQKAYKSNLFCNWTTLVMMTCFMLQIQE